MIPYGRQDITQADVDAVVDVLRSDFLTQGPAVPRFERDLMAVTGAAHAVAMNSATSALHVACMALGLRPGDLLWTVPNTFVASANCARYCGADVDFVDIDPVSWNMSVPALRAKLVAARAAQRVPKVVVPVHFSGQPTDQEEIYALGREFGFRIIEDASHAIGASRRGEAVGSCRWSDVTVLSFHPVKVVTTAEGGAALTNDAAIAEQMARLRTHGITRDARQFRAGADQGPWHYEQLELGYNYRMTDLQAALGSSQLARLSGYIDRRNELARRYDAQLETVPVARPGVGRENRSAFHLYVVRVRDDSGALRRRVVESMRAAGVGVNVHYMPVHLQPYYRSLGFREGQFAESETHGRTAVTLPLYPTMTNDEQDIVVHRLREALAD